MKKKIASRKNLAHGEFHQPLVSLFIFYSDILIHYKEDARHIFACNR